jgi:2-hydroxychromene-2-carboxylate isomerase
MRIDWYFDVISPYAYLQSHDLAGLAARTRIAMKPVLLAGLLNHWGQRGPAEIPPKRLFTYRHVRWLAAQRGLPMRMPAAHPFNPLRLLRLACAAGDDLGAVRRIFAFVWEEGGDPHDAAAVIALGHAIGIADPQAALSAPGVKQRLKDNGAEAIAAGVFGVPTVVVGGVVLWGQDAMPMVRAALDTPGLFASADDARLAALPVAASRL